MSSISVLGDGLAGLLLAHALQEAGWEAQVLGDGCPNTPPVALVHLFAGRTFRRSALEVRAFERAVEHWRAESLARELSVLRKVEPGDRLDRSARDHGLPQAYAPRPSSKSGWWEYQPAFSVMAQALACRLSSQLKIHMRRVDRPHDLPSPRVLALGVKAAQSFPGTAWDRSAGRTVEAVPLAPLPPAILIGSGMHLAPVLDGPSVVLGGRFSALEGARGDELETALELTGVAHEERFVWSGERLALAADRRPLLGWLDDETFVFLGFGSRGLFWLPYCVELATQALQDRDFALPPELDWRRAQGFAGADFRPET